MLLSYLLGIAFMALVTIAVSIPLLLAFKKKKYAVLLPIVATVILLKTIAVIQLGYVDLMFLFILILIAVPTALFVYYLIGRTRKSVM